MLINRLSSTALEVATQCMYRFKIQYVERGEEADGKAATLGSTVHSTLEIWVDRCYLKQVQEPTLESLIEIWKLCHASTYGFGAAPTEFKLGVDLLTRWFNRGDLRQQGRRVLSVEEKKTFPIKVDGVEIDFVYIRDRLDVLEDGSLVVVDYKTSAWNVDHDTLLYEKIQPPVYALATQIEYPDAPGIWVEFDMLKHENQPVGVYFSAEDSKNTWRKLKKRIRDILAAPDDPKPKLNDTCLFCPAKTSCPAVLSNAAIGGPYGTSPEEIVDRLTELEYLEKAAKAGRNELTNLLLGIAKNTDTLEFQGSDSKAFVTMQRRREIDPDRARIVIGETLWKKYGSTSLTLGTVDKLLKSDDLTDEQKRDLGNLISTGYGDPYFKVKPNKGL